MSLKFGILGLLSDGEKTGYDLMKIFNSSLQFFWHAQTSQIYRELGTLEQNKLVESVEYEQRDKPNKKIFSITEKGKRAFVSWLDNHKCNEKYRDSMTMRIFFSSKGDTEKLRNELEIYRFDNLKYLSTLELVEKGSEVKSSLYYMLAVERGKLISKANIEWVEFCLNKLKEIPNE